MVGASFVLKLGNRSNILSLLHFLRSSTNCSKRNELQYKREIPHRGSSSNLLRAFVHLNWMRRKFLLQSQSLPNTYTIITANVNVHFREICIKSMTWPSKKSLANNWKIHFSIRYGVYTSWCWLLTENASDIRSELQFLIAISTGCLSQRFEDGTYIIPAFTFI